MWMDGTMTGLWQSSKEWSATTALRLRARYLSCLVLISLWHCDARRFSRRVISLSTNFSKSNALLNRSTSSGDNKQKLEDAINCIIFWTWNDNQTADFFISADTIKKWNDSNNLNNSNMLSLNIQVARLQEGYSDGVDTRQLHSSSLSENLNQSDLYHCHRNYQHHHYSWRSFRWLKVRQDGWNWWSERCVIHNNNYVHLYSYDV